MDSQSRSPRYPQVSLREALSRVQQVYLKENKHKADKEVIAKDLGYAGINGASLGMIAALKHYGLLENVGDGLRISDAAVAILDLPRNDPSRSEAIKRVAFSPKLFAELFASYSFKLPSDENLKQSLTKKGFTDKAATSIVRTYRDTIGLVQEETEGYTSGASESSRSREAVQTMPSAAVQPSPEIQQESAPPEGVYTFSTPLSFPRNVKAEVRIYGKNLKKSDITRLKNAIADLEGAFEDETESPSVSVEQPTEDKEV
jgi:hypothetical protein